jgi:hypothetical protein
MNSIVVTWFDSSPAIFIIHNMIHYYLRRIFCNTIFLLIYLKLMPSSFHVK